MRQTLVDGNGRYIHIFFFFYYYQIIYDISYFQGFKYFARRLRANRLTGSQQIR